VCVHLCVGRGTSNSVLVVCINNMCIRKYIMVVHAIVGIIVNKRFIFQRYFCLRNNITIVCSLSMYHPVQLIVYIVHDGYK